MALPFSRNTVYAALSQLKSADLNDIQDEIINEFLGTPLIAPPALASDTNDYAPAGIDTARTIRQDLSASVTLTGLTGGAGGHVDGRRIRLVSVHEASFKLELAHEGPGSAAANRFALPRGQTVVLSQHEYALLRYDGTAARWVLLATTGRTVDRAVRDVPFEGAFVTGPGSPQVQVDAQELSLPSATDRAYITLPMRRNDIIHGVSARYIGSISPTFTVNIYSYIGNTKTLLGTASGTSTSTDWLDVDLEATSGSYPKLSRHERIVIELRSTAGSIIVYKIEADIEIPTPG